MRAETDPVAAPFCDHAVSACYPWARRILSFSSYFELRFPRSAREQVEGIPDRRPQLSGVRKMHFSN